MTKLLKIRQWLTTSEAARHLSTLFQEEVTTADILRLALDGRLGLAIHFVNHAKGRRGHIVPMERAQLREIPSELLGSGPDGAPVGKPDLTLVGINLDDKRVLELEDDVVTLQGVYDLPMIGGEVLDVEHEFQQLTGGPSVTLTNLEGAFVQEDDDTLYQLQESFDENEYQMGSRAHLHKLKQRIEMEQLSKENADRLLRGHDKDRKAFLALEKSKPIKDRYYPSAGLPRDAALVVRTSALRELQDSLQGGEESGPQGQPF